jgi:hypothetical protein
MATATLQWAEKAPAVGIGNRAQLEQRLFELAQKSCRLPILAVLNMPDGTAGYIGLGRPQSIVFFHGARGADGLTEEWIPIGQDAHPGYTSFYLLGQHHSEFENRSLLPTCDAIRALCEFFERGTRPAWIRWEQNRF